MTGSSGGRRLSVIIKRQAVFAQDTHDRGKPSAYQINIMDIRSICSNRGVLLENGWSRIRCN